MRKTFAILTIIALISVHASAQSSDRSTVAFTLNEEEVLPESVAYDPNTRSFYVGSTRKGEIIKVDAEGNQSTFVAGGEFGHWMIIGIKIDPKRNEIWFCSSGGGNLVGYDLKDETDGRPAGVFKVNLATGELIKKYTLEASGEVHFFNDLTIQDNGDVYATHMFNDHSVYKIDRETDELELYVETDLIKYPNGITFSDDQQYLFVAHSEGIARVSLAEGKAVNLDVIKGADVSYKGSLDGLYFYKNTLLGVQPGLSRVAQFDLSMPMDAIMEQIVLDENHPQMDHPTTGVLVGDDFYYVANAQFEKVNEDGTISQSLSKPIILKINLGGK